MKTYEIELTAKIKSNLSIKKLENKLVIALHDIETGYSKLDGIDNELEVIEYNSITATRIYEK
jgi:hypothetical protein